MPSRSSQRTRPSSTKATTTSNPTANTNINKESKRMALTTDQINELLADNRGRGDYGQYLRDFVQSGSPGEQVDMESGLLAGKTPDKVKTGLENAKKSRDKEGVLKHPEAQDVLIIKKGDVVFVVNRGVQAGE